ncbi:PucR family transcriptional regulator ligand-binding domain-containing protein [Actinomadura sp. J1-007]|uniref:PucR family transcriptional regulator ligand-binding domain-containing protein n=1 Tax=Actinomadura sp. J1-007 TaxID=2661913 RepID=UPI001F4FD232|nr:PucR family transcriptional regulator ligand-binding domain-containing protein [Actinomadura sp. J1-007]
MEPTVRAILDLPIFREAGVRVAAGERNLHRSVRWVHAGEIPDIYRFLSGGEMLLTAGLGIGRDEREQRDYVRRIATAGAAVLVVELAGRAFGAMPPAVAEEAERHGLPLIGLRDEIPFAEVSALVHEMLVGMRLQELSAEEAVSEAFMNLLLDGADHLSLTTELAHRVGHPVVLEDMAHQVLAYAGPTMESDRVVADWNTHSRVLHGTPPGGPAPGGTPPAGAPPAGESPWTAPGGPSCCAASAGAGCTSCTAATCWPRRACTRWSGRPPPSRSRCSASAPAAPARRSGRAPWSTGSCSATCPARTSSPRRCASAATCGAARSW